MRQNASKWMWTSWVVLAAITCAWSQTGPDRPGVGQVDEPIAEAVADQPADETPAASEDQSQSQSLSIPFDTPSRSYMQSGLRISQGADSDPGGILGNSPQLSSATSISGMARFLKLTQHYQTGVDYVGGGTFYSSYGNGGVHDERFQQIGVDQRIIWHRTEFSLRDTFRRFQGEQLGLSSFGNVNASSLAPGLDAKDSARGTVADDVLTNEPAELFQRSSHGNVAMVEVTQALSRRASAFVSATYSFTDYLTPGEHLVGDRQVALRAGSIYRLNRRDSIGAMLGYREFRFSQSGARDVTSISAQVFYSHQISRRLDFTVGAGPEVTRVPDFTSHNTSNLNVTAQASARYRLEKVNLGFTYTRLVTAGSGFLAGGNSDTVQFSLARDFARTWHAELNLGYNNSRSLTPKAIGASTGFYQYGFMGAAVRRRLGPRIEAFASYQFSDENFDRVLCATCNRGVQQRHIMLIGFNLQLRPIRFE